MRRFIAVLLLVLVPTQYTWSMAQGLHGHLSGDASMTTSHTHADHLPAVDEHDHEGLADHQSDALLDTADSSTGTGDHASHYHPLFNTLVFELALKLAQAAPAGPPLRLSEAFTSHIPSRFDRPPLGLL